MTDTILTVRSYRDRVAALFSAYPKERISTDRLQKAGGHDAWRSRVSDCRLELKMDIVWDPIRHGKKRRCTCGCTRNWTQSFYVYFPPEPVAAEVPTEGHDLNQWDLR